MKFMTTKFVMFLFLCIFGCTKPELIEDKKIAALQMETALSIDVFKETAKSLIGSNIIWTNNRVVRFTAIGQDVHTESLATAKVNRDLISKIQKLFATQRLQSVFITSSRVNFVLSGDGIAPSGTAIGLFFALKDESNSGCTFFVSEINKATANKRGVFCVRLDENSFFYLDR
jgi:hypothetical protein